MNAQSVAQLVPILQTAIGPTILISGVGLLLLAMTNRLNHILDRTRQLSVQSQDCQDEARELKEAQLSILWQRATLVRRAIICASSSALSAALLIVNLFLAALFGIEDTWLICGLFVLAMASLILSLLFFMRDIDQSLTALRWEIASNGGAEALSGLPLPRYAPASGTPLSPASHRTPRSATPVSPRAGRRWS